MSAWHRENPELAGTWADPWMQHESYRKALGTYHAERIEPDVDFDVRREADEEDGS